LRESCNKIHVGKLVVI